MLRKKLLALIATLVILPVAAFAQTTDTGTTTATNTITTCMQSALEKRELALISAHDSYASSTKAAITNRLTGLKLSWNETDKKARIAKREATYRAFRNEMQSANTNLRTSKNLAWKTFQSDAKSCGVKATGELPSLITGSNTSL